MIHRNTNKFVLLVALIAGVLITAAMFTGKLNAQDRVPYGQTSAEQGSKTKEAFRIGTYNPQTAFEQHPLQEKLMKQYTSLQAAIKKAQQDGDKDKVMQLQQQFEQQRNQIVEQFQRDVEKVLPEAAEAADVKVIAVEIAYTADDVTPQDVTAHIVRYCESLYR